MSSTTVKEIETARSKLFGEMLGEMLSLSCTPDELFANPAFAADLRKKAHGFYDRWNELSKQSAKATMEIAAKDADDEV